MTIKHLPPRWPLDNPPAGMRLQLGKVAAALRVTVTEMSAQTGLPRTSMYRLLTNEWPDRTSEQDRRAIRAALNALFCERGASPEQLAVLWHAQGHKPQHGDASTDKHGRPVGYRTAHPAGYPTGHPTGHPTAHPNEDPEMLLAKQSLSPQAHRHFKIFVNPFDGDVSSTEMMFDGADVRYVREAAWQCSQVGGFVAIVGESGAGKTTIQADLEERIARSADPVTIIRPSVLGMEQSERQGAQLKSADILHAIISQMDPQRSVPQTLQARTVLAQKLLAASALVGNRHLLVVEEAHSMPNATLKHLKRLHEMRNGRRPLLGILLLAQTELKTRLANGLRDGTLREVAQRCEVIELLPLDNDLSGYLACRAAAAGATLDALIDTAGIAALRKRLTIRDSAGRGADTSMCYPLAVNNMMTKCLNEAADIGSPLVTELVVKSI